jgi:hypothetical protein
MWVTAVFAELPFKGDRDDRQPDAERDVDRRIVTNGLQHVGRIGHGNGK